MGVLKCAKTSLSGSHLKAVILSEVEPVLINQWADWDALVHILGWHDFVLKPNLSKQVSTCAREWAFLF